MLSEKTLLLGHDQHAFAIAEAGRRDNDFLGGRCR
jgi:hypothetical protein